MTLAQYLMLAVAVFSALAWRWNATAAALAFAYFVTEGWYLLAERPLDAGELFMIDAFTITLVFCKAIARCPVAEFTTTRQHLRCMVEALTPCDRIVLAIFPLAWIVYCLNISEVTWWWSLWVLALVQFIAAGHEAINNRRRAKALLSEPGIPSSGLMFAVARAGRWST